MNVRQRALISVFDKTGIIDMAQVLLAAGFELLSYQAGPQSCCATRGWR